MRGIVVAGVQPHGLVNGAGGMEHVAQTYQHALLVVRPARVIRVPMDERLQLSLVKANALAENRDVDAPFVFAAAYSDAPCPEGQTS